ncbi:L-2-hydroxyglutarate oxidase [Phytoactinopolyspora alkaliphila]|uniref:L-2-hydroxyglutarate oxidase n=1 Tax=Phytoactinopolyspora alkaliphila TaxID=1783498 RepID=A0A6N9YQ24_9ACTN|nr:L-2-hydroxyglutarate oxidase [Phytoactinopolyspora alkaliphila]NED96929.1 L-2-hydroxyglutarate oxidase [Phytoactinopolyspora alkaliphila]
MARRYAVVGGGIIGAAVARAISLFHQPAHVSVLEKEPTPGLHQTGRNSGVVHAGLYYTPGSAKARFARRGIGLLRAYCDEHGLTYDECGKVLVALTDQDRRRLADIEARAKANGVPGIRMLDADQIREIEPHVSGIAGLHSPTTAIVDFAAVARQMLEEAAEAGADVRTGVDVTGFREVAGEVHVSGRDAQAGAAQVLGAFDYVVICAGLHADRLARLAGDDEYPRIVPFRGEFAALRDDRRHLVNGLVYPVPDPRYPFLGVHLTKRVNGGVLIGPNAVLALAREGYGRGQIDIRELGRLAGWAGFRRFARKNWRTGVREVYGSVSRRAFVSAARRYVPELRLDDVVPAPAGVRAQAMDADGTLVDDFRVSRRGRILCVRNAPSPAATAALAIADDILTELHRE